MQLLKIEKECLHIICWVLFLWYHFQRESPNADTYTRTHRSDHFARSKHLVLFNMQITFVITNKRHVVEKPTEEQQQQQQLKWRHQRKKSYTPLAVNTTRKYVNGPDLIQLRHTCQQQTHKKRNLKASSASRLPLPPPLLSPSSSTIEWISETEHDAKQTKSKVH